jgi:hypothetical protein
MKILLHEAQVIHSKSLGKLLNYIYKKEEYAVTMGDSFRDPRSHGRYGDQSPYGSPTSLHKVRCATDLNLFIEDGYQTNSEKYHDLGEYWESLSPHNVWGGRFQDGNHFETRRNVR